MNDEGSRIEALRGALEAINTQYLYIVAKYGENPSQDVLERLNNISKSMLMLFDEIDFLREDK